ncbi:MAG: galactofuranose transport system substrate-binding protein [Frankiaceae bacterium]|nr:galactofuranose transport system substrate-binding protein [Frankiaceae bacterium]
MTARFSTRTGRTLVLTVGISLAAVGCSSKSSTTAAAPGTTTTAASSASSATSPADTSSASTAPSTSGDLCTAAKLGYPAITDFHGVKVGFSQSEPDNASFRAAETQSMKDEATKQGATLLYANANKDPAKQIADIKDLITKGAKLLIVAPLNSDGLQPAWAAAAAAKVPVVTVDRLVSQTPCKDYLTFIGSNFVSQGKRAADAMGEALAGKGNVVILLGSSGNGVTTDRTSGFVEEMKAKYPGVTISKQQTGNFDRATGQTVASQLLQADSSITGIYAENDEMGVGAYNAIKAAGKTPGKDIKIVSIDGIKDAVSKIITGQYTAVIQSNPRFGPLAFQALTDFESGKGTPAKIIITDGDYLNAADAKAKLDQAF